MFRVRRLTTAEETVTIFGPRKVELGWIPGALDDVNYFAADETGFFAGELDGKVISCISVVKYSDAYAYLGQYIVDKAYRGKGYGLETWKFSLSSLPDGCNCGLDAVVEMVPIYERSGFKPAWNTHRITISINLALLHSLTCPESITIKPLTHVPFHQILKYDTSVHVYERKLFLEKWISAKNCLGFAAVNPQGNVVGYAVVRTIMKKEDGWRIGPLFADNSQIARGLYCAMIEGVAAQHSTASITMDVPCGDGCNPDAIDILLTELSGFVTDRYVRMYTMGPPPNYPLQKMYVVTSVELG